MKVKPCSLFCFGFLTGLLALMLGALCPGVLAAETVESVEDGPDGLIRIELKETEDHRSRENVEFELYRVADLVDGDLVYFEPYSSCTLQVDQLDQFDEMKDALTLLKKQTRKEKPDQNAKSDADGVVVFEGLERGLYFLHVSDPARYERVEDVIVTLPVYNEEEGRMENKVSVFAKSWPLPMVEIIKTDTNHQVLEGMDFEFSSFRDADTQEVIERKSAQPDGHVCFSLNLNQTIYIKETRAPEGYILSAKVIEIALDEEGQLTIDGQPVELTNNKAVIEVQNRQATKAKTGVNSHTAACIGILLVSLMGVIVLLVFKKKRFE